MNNLINEISNAEKKHTTYVFHPILAKEEAEVANNELKDILQDYYEGIRDIFYQLCISDDFQYKILITRRAYILYQIFASIFTLCPESRSDNADNFCIKGEFYNSHSLEFINRCENLNEHNFVIFDDIIVHGRTLRNTVNKLLKKSIKLDKITIYCLLKNKDASCLSEDIKKRITVYEPCNEEVWKVLSDELTEIVFKYGQGYTSYIDTYKLQFKNRIGKENLFDSIFEHFSNDKSYKVLERKQLEKFETNYFVAFSKKYDESYKSVSCIRFYEHDNSLICIPYVFVDTVKKENIFKYAFRLLRENNIDKVPRCFFKNDIFQPKFELSTLFLKWTINAIGEKLLAVALDSMDFCVSRIVERRETFWLVDNSDMLTIPESNDLFDIEITYNNEILFCINILKISLKEVKSLLVKQNPTKEEIYDLIQTALIVYSYKIKEEDETRAKNNKDRCFGIRVSDTVDVCWNFIKNNYETTNIDKKDMKNEVMQLFIQNWDCGTASYDFVSYEDENGNYFVSEFMKNGEQVFRSLYEKFQEIYQYYYAYSVRTLTTDVKKLYEFGSYLINHLFGIQKTQAKLFNEYLKINTSYYADVYVVDPTCYPDEAFTIVDNYLETYLTGRDIKDER